MNETSLNGTSMDIIADNIQKLKEIFPEVFCEDSIDFEKLQAVLGNYIDADNERYNFSWWGKAQALRLAQTPSTGTLRPCKEESKDWDTTQNLYIEGDNLEVLKLLQKTYHNKVKMIYIDPPYNTGNDFVYADTFKDTIENYKLVTGQYDDKGKMLNTNTETNGRYHTEWLNMLYPRLKLARNLLSDMGVIFISIDDNELYNLKKICDEIFGQDNFVANFIWEKRVTRENRKNISVRHDYILCYVKNREYMSESIGLLPMNQDAIDRYKNPDNDSRGVWTSVPAIAQAGHGTVNQFYTLTTPSGREVNPPSGSCWRYTKERMKEAIEDNRIWFGADGNGVPRIKKFLNEGKQGLTPETLLTATAVGTNDSAKRELVSLFKGVAVFETPKSMSLLQLLIQICNFNKEEIVLDFFSGTATMAHAILEQNRQDGLNRRFIMVQLPEICEEKSEAFKFGLKNICEIGKERIRRAGEKIKEELKADIGIDVGFKVFKLDKSNIKQWAPEYDDIEQTLFNHINNFVEGRTELDVVFEIMLKYGIDLNFPIEEYTLCNKKVYSIGFGALIICLGNDITTDLANEIIKLKEELDPDITRIVFKDNGFKNDATKTNVKEVLKINGIDEMVSI